MDLTAPFLTLEIDDGLYAISIDHVREILDVREITRLPNAPMHLLGLIDLRGSSIPIADMRSLMGFMSTYDDANTRFVVVDVADRLIGLRCDKVREVIRIDEGSFETIELDRLLNWRERAVLGTARYNKRPLTLLDISELFGGFGGGGFFAAAE